MILLRLVDNLTYSSIYSYPMFPLQVANPMTDAPIDTKTNISYGTHSSRVATEDEQGYTYMRSAVSPAVPQPHLGELTWIIAMIEK